MGERVSRSMSYVTVRRSRQIEVLCLISVVAFIIVGTFTLILWRRNKPAISSDKCGPNYPAFSVNISGAVKNDDGGYRTADGMVFPHGSFWSENKYIFGCPCSIKPCVRKCCLPHQTYDPDTQNCTVDNSPSFHLFTSNVYSNMKFIESASDLKLKQVSNNHFFVLYGDVCTNDKFPRLPELDPNDKTYLMEDGRILTTGSSLPYLDQSEYCLESFLGNDTVYTIECFPDESVQKSQERDSWVFTYLASGMIVSVPFLMATLLVYALLPQMQNLHGKALICHVTCLTIAYLALAVVQIGDIDVPSTLCETLAFVVQFTFLASFFWLNIMCFDIWWTFSGLMSMRGSIKDTEHCKFLIYSCYAWGCPILISSTTMFMELSSWVPNTFIKPHFNIDRCWFKGDDPVILYFYLPIGVLLCLNLFVFTTTSCRLRTRDSSFRGDSRRHSSSNADRKRFNLYLKLFVVMGVPWVMEVVSFMLGGHLKIWLVTDIANTLQGLLIFVIFVCNRRTLRLLGQRFCPSLQLGGPTPSLASRTFSSRFSRSGSSTKINRVSIQKSDSVYISKL